MEGEETLCEESILQCEARETKATILVAGNEGHVQK